MSAEQLPESGAAVVEQPLRAPDVPNSPRQLLTVAEVSKLPALLSVADLAPIWGVTVSQAHRLNRHGAFDAFKVSRPIGPRQFSGALLRHYLQGTDLRPLATRAFRRSR